MPRRIDWKIVRPLVEQVMAGKLSDADGAARLGVTLRSFRGYLPVVAAMKRGDIRTGTESPPATLSPEPSASGSSPSSTPSPAGNSPEPSKPTEPAAAPASTPAPAVNLPNPSKTRNSPSKKRDLLDDLLG